MKIASACALATGGLLLAAAFGEARAHPHVWVESRSQIVFGQSGALDGVRHRWTFDEMFSAYAIQGLDADGDGTYTREELEPLAEVNVESLSEFAFFTFLQIGDMEGAFAEPVDYWLEHDGVQLTLHFTLPLRDPIIMDGRELSIEVYDPTFFVDFRLAESDTAQLSGAPGSCALDVERAEGFDDQIASRLAEIPADVRDLPQELLAVTEGNANVIRVDCR